MKFNSINSLYEFIETLGDMGYYIPFTLQELRKKVKESGFYISEYEVHIDFVKYQKYLRILLSKKDVVIIEIVGYMYEN